MTPKQIDEFKKLDELLKHGFQLSKCFTNGPAVIADMYFDHPGEVIACLKKYV